MVYQRKIFQKIESYADTPEAIVITGMRRVGKTTSLKFFYSQIATENKLMLDLEDPLNRGIFEVAGYEEIVRSFQERGINFDEKNYIFLDEIQFVKNIPSVVKFFIDHYSTKFYLTGSASFYLKNLFSESLSGRKQIFELYPLDYEEFLIFKQNKYQLPSFNEKVTEQTFNLHKPLMSEYLDWGGMPGVVNSSVGNKEDKLKDIFSSYYQKEIETLADFRKNKEIKNLIGLLSKRVGQKLDIERLSKEIRVSRPTVYNFLEFLSGTYFVKLITAYGGKSTAVRKQNKVYLTDHGFNKILEVPYSGSRFENVVFEQLRSSGDLSYYHSNGQEIDFILKRGGQNYAFEVKETATKSDLKSLKKKANKLEIENYYLVSKNYVGLNRVKYIFQLPEI